MIKLDSSFGYVATENTPSGNKFILSGVNIMSYRSPCILAALCHFFDFYLIFAWSSKWLLYTLLFPLLSFILSLSPPKYVILDFCSIFPFLFNTLLCRSLLFQ